MIDACNIVQNQLISMLRHFLWIFYTFSGTTEDDGDDRFGMPSKNHSPISQVSLISKYWSIRDIIQCIRLSDTCNIFDCTNHFKMARVNSFSPYIADTYINPHPY
jgi:hypothetical protein